MKKEKLCERKERNRLIIAVLAALCATSAPAFLLVSVGSVFGQVSDLPEYYAAARMVWDGRFPDIYDRLRLIQEEQHLFPSLGDRGVVLYIPPFSFLLLAPLGLVPVDQVATVWTGILVACCLASVMTLKAAFGLDAPKTLWLYALMCIAAPIYEGLRIGQLAPVMLLAFSVALHLLRKGQDGTAGVALSTLVLKPPELLPIWVFLAAAGRRRVAGAIVGVFIALVVASLIVPGGVSAYASYMTLVGRGSENLQFMQPELSATLRGQLLRLGVGPSVADAISVVVLVAVLVLIAYAGRRAARLKAESTDAAPGSSGLPGAGLSVSCRDGAGGAGAAGGVAGGVAEGVAERASYLVAGILAVAVPLGLVSALHCHDYDLVLMIPTLVALLSGRLTGVAVVVTAACLSGMAVFMIPLYLDIHYGYLMGGGVVNPGFIAMLVIAAGLAMQWWLHPSGLIRGSVPAFRVDPEGARVDTGSGEVGDKEKRDRDSGSARD